MGRIVTHSGSAGGRGGLLRRTIFTCYGLFRLRTFLTRYYWVWEFDFSAISGLQPTEQLLGHQMGINFGNSFPKVLDDISKLIGCPHPVSQLWGRFPIRSSNIRFLHSAAVKLKLRSQ